MKKIFAFAMAFVSMAAVMTSCSNDDADFVMQSVPAAPKQQSNNEEVKSGFDGTIYFFAYESQFNYINTEYTLQVGSETMQINVENLQTATKLPYSIKMAFEQKEALCALANKEFVRPTVFAYHIPANMKGEVKLVYNFSVKQGVEFPEEIEYYRGAATNGKNLSSGIAVAGRDAERTINSLNGRTALTETL